MTDPTYVPARALLARIGAGRTLAESFDHRWATDYGQDKADAVYAALRAAIDFDQPPRVRLAQARAVLADSPALSDLRPIPRRRRRIKTSRHTDHMVYLLYGADGDLLYIGITDRGPTRLAEHHRTKAWFEDVYRVEFERCATREAATLREEYLIERLGPVHNVQHNRSHAVLLHGDRSPRRVAP